MIKLLDWFRKKLDVLIVFLAVSEEAFLGDGDEHGVLGSVDI